MQKPVERVWDLTIAPDTVRLVIEKARTISAAVNEDYEDGAEHEVEIGGDSRDNHHHDGLAEEATEDLTEQELRQLIRELNVDEAAELIHTSRIARCIIIPKASFEETDGINPATKNKASIATNVVLQCVN